MRLMSACLFLMMKVEEMNANKEVEYIAEPTAMISISETEVIK